MKTIEELYNKAFAVRENAYAPYSNFFVGACLESDKGNLYTGCNVENAAYGVTICAETNAVTAMIAGGDRKIKRMVVVTDSMEPSSPCGSCRQCIYEFSNKETEIYLFNLTRNQKIFTIEELLPHRFRFC